MGRINSTVSELGVENGRFPSQPQPNPKAQNNKGVNSITIQSVKVVDKPSPSTNQTIRIDDDEGDKEEVEPPLSVPFPHLLKAPETSIDHGEIINQLKQVKVNLPLFLVIKNIPSFAKVIKDLCTLK